MGANHGILLVWTDVDAAFQPEFHAWYNQEHLRERVEVPGFLNARRYRAAIGEPGFFAVYDTESPAVLTSEAYRRRLAAQTPWSGRVFKGFRNTVRVLGEVAGEAGGGYAGHLLSVRIAPKPGQSEALAQTLSGRLAALLDRPDVTRALAVRGQLAGLEQFPNVPGGKPTDPATVVMLVEASDPQVLDNIAQETLSDAALTQWGAQGTAHRARYTLQYALVR